MSAPFYAVIQNILHEWSAYRGIIPRNMYDGIDSAEQLCSPGR